MDHISGIDALFVANIVLVIREKLAKIFEGCFNGGLEKILSGFCSILTLSEGYGHKRTSIEASNSNRKNKWTRFFLASII